MRVVVNDQYLDLPPGQPVMVLVELEGEETVPSIHLTFSGGCLHVPGGLEVKTQDEVPCLTIGVEPPNTSPVLVNGRPFPQEG